MELQYRSMLFIVLICVVGQGLAVDPTRDSCKEGAEVPPTRTDTAEQVRRLRELMNTNGVYAFIVPTDDDHQNEYVGESDKKRSFISGFSGSAGTALVTQDAQLLWTDGRYFLEAADQLDCEWLLMRSGEKDVPSLSEWITKNLQPGQVVGADAKVISTASWKRYEETFDKKGLTMQHVGDLVGQVWDDMPSSDRPLPSNNEVFPLEQRFAGRTWQQKVADLRNELNEKDAEAVVISALDEVAWLFNLRGSDIAYNPVFFAYAIVDKDDSISPRLYLRSADSRIADLAAHLNCGTDGACAEAECVRVFAYDKVDDGVENYNEEGDINSTIWVSSSTNYHITSLLQNPKRIEDSPSPLLLMKAIKNPTERDGMRNSHIRDSAAIAQFISRLERELEQGVKWDEMKVAREIDGLRREQQYNRGLSFGTIAGSGTNGAYIHYSPTNITNNAVNKTNMLLLDSGGQYLDGTTDITRTFHFGTPTEFQKLAYTLVLLGVIDLAMMKFPANRTLGSSLDTLARRRLWEYGLDFGHGTGHGIGMFLNVHEGPARIAAKRASSSVSNERPLYDGMFFSDEPGYYDAQKGFGVRLETIIMARYVDTEYGKPQTTLEFETIALVPFEKKLIKLEMLDRKQRMWLNDYHKKCLEKTGDALKATGHTEAYTWLEKRTHPFPLTDDTPSTMPAQATSATTNRGSSIRSVSHILFIAFAAVF